MLVALDAILLLLSTILVVGFALVVKPRRRELVAWALGYAALMAGVGLFALRGIVPDFISIVLANMLILSFFPLIAVGGDFFRGRKPRYFLVAIGAAAAFLWFLWFGVLQPSYPPRFWFYNLFVAAASVLGALSIARGARPSFRAVSRIAAALLACLAAVNLSRLYFGFAGLPEDIMDSESWEGAIQSMAGFLVIVLSFTLLILHERRENDELAASARERELLVREISHRTKNDLAMVDSLISLELDALEAREPASPGIARVLSRLESLRSRIMCLSEAHDRLSRSDSPGKVRLDEYLDVIASALPAREGVAVERAFDRVEAGFALAAPLGLALNELATNALKHAFPEGKGGTVRISLRSVPSEGGGAKATLEVRDDGVGALWPSEKPGLGSTIVESFARKLGGKLEYSNDGGSVFSLRFELPPA